MKTPRRTQVSLAIIELLPAYTPVVYFNEWSRWWLACRGLRSGLFTLLLCPPLIM